MLLSASRISTQKSVSSKISMFNGIGEFSGCPLHRAFFDIPYTDLNSSSQRMLSVESVEYSPVKSNKIKRVELSRCVALGILFNDSNS